MSSMTSLFRPLLTSLLCCVIALGQLPALLHVASCHGHAQGLPSVAESTSSNACAHGCHNHATDQYPAEALALGDTSQSNHDHESPGVPPHDSDHCATCHSLANPVGFGWKFELPHVQNYLCELISICADRLPVEASITIPQPRGPPVVA